MHKFLTCNKGRLPLLRKAPDPCYQEQIAITEPLYNLEEKYDYKVAISPYEFIGTVVYL